MADNGKFKTDGKDAVNLLSNNTTVQFGRSVTKEDVKEKLFDGDINDTVLQGEPKLPKERCIVRVCDHSDDSADTVLWDDVPNLPNLPKERCIVRVCDHNDDSADTVLWDDIVHGKDSNPCSTTNNNGTEKEGESLLQTQFNGTSYSSANRQDEWAEKLVFKGVDHPCYRHLPKGWVQAVHSSGLPIFLHKETRVCTFTRPYFLGQNSLRNHDLPISNIPCFLYRKMYENVATGQVKTEITNGDERQFTVKTEVNSEDEAQVRTGTEAVSRDETEIKTEVLSDDEEQLKIKAADMSNNDFQTDVNSEASSGDELHGNVNPEVRSDYEVKDVPVSTQEVTFGKFNALFFTNDEVQDYCKKLFPHEVIKYKPQRLKEFGERRRPNRLSNNVRVITCPLTHSSLKELFVTVQGKNYCSILHAYATRFMMISPSFDFVSPQKPDGVYKATVILKGKEYGSGFGTSKKAAKLEAAKATLEILVPQMKDYISMDEESKNTAPPVDSYSKSFCFSDMEILDERVADFLATMGEFSPYEILQNSLRINTGTPVRIQTEIKHLERGIELTMKVLDQSVSVRCPSIVLGKRKAAQIMLKLLHPDLKNWDSLLQLYGKNAIQKRKEEKLLDPDITKQNVLKSKVYDGDPIIKKLKQEMQKLYETRQNKSNEKFSPPQGLSNFTGSQMECDK